MLWHAAHTCWNLLSPREACRAVNTPSNTDLPAALAASGCDEPGVTSGCAALGVTSACAAPGEGAVAPGGWTEPHAVRARAQTHATANLAREVALRIHRDERRTIDALPTIDARLTTDGPLTTRGAAVPPVLRASFHRSAPRCTDAPRACRSSCRTGRRRADRWSPSAHRSACPPRGDAAHRPSPRR